MIKNSEGLTFVEWKKQLNRHVVERCGIGADDLPDWDMYSSWESGTDPVLAAEEVLQNACDDMGFDFDYIFGGED